MQKRKDPSQRGAKLNCDLVEWNEARLSSGFGEVGSFPYTYGVRSAETRIVTHLEAP
jgi:hypothetical protein